jgi:hypothetical protein
VEFFFPPFSPFTKNKEVRKMDSYGKKPQKIGYSLVWAAALMTTQVDAFEMGEGLAPPPVISFISPLPPPPLEQGGGQQPPLFPSSALLDSPSVPSPSQGDVWPQRLKKIGTGAWVFQGIATGLYLLSSWRSPSSPRFLFKGIGLVLMISKYGLWGGAKAVKGRKEVWTTETAQEMLMPLLMDALTLALFHEIKMKEQLSKEKEKAFVEGEGLTRNLRVLKEETKSYEGMGLFLSTVGKRLVKGKSSYKAWPFLLTAKRLGVRRDSLQRGLLYLMSDYPLYDREEVIPYLEEASALGFPEACVALGEIYAEKEGSDNKERALAYWGRAEELLKGEESRDKKEAGFKKLNNLYKGVKEYPCALRCLHEVEACQKRAGALGED